jgi:hypothetical protein
MPLQAVTALDVHDGILKLILKARPGQPLLRISMSDGTKLQFHTNLAALWKTTFDHAKAALMTDL